MAANLLRSNTSGVHGMRLRQRGKDGQRLVIDYFWRAGGRVRASSVDVGAQPLKAVEAAMTLREGHTGVGTGLTPRQAWIRLRHSLEAGASSRGPGK